jgi:hypothetical protein
MFAWKTQGRWWFAYAYFGPGDGSQFET